MEFNLKVQFSTLHIHKGCRKRSELTEKSVYDVLGAAALIEKKGKPKDERSNVEIVNILSIIQIHDRTCSYLHIIKNRSSLSIHKLVHRGTIFVKRLTEKLFVICFACPPKGNLKTGRKTGGAN
jgi:hypothetical protein